MKLSTNDKKNVPGSVMFILSTTLERDRSQIHHKIMKGERKRKNNLFQKGRVAYNKGSKRESGEASDLGSIQYVRPTRQELDFVQENPILCTEKPPEEISDSAQGLLKILRPSPHPATAVQEKNTGVKDTRWVQFEIYACMNM